MPTKAGGFSVADLQAFVAKGVTTQAAVDEALGRKPEKSNTLIKGERRVGPVMNKTEARYALTLEAMKRRGDIADYKAFGIKLRWGVDDKTGASMIYTPDFFVRMPELTGHEAQGAGSRTHKLIEIKGGHIWPKDKVRFKGCRAEWQWLFDFEIHQWIDGQWLELAI